MNKTINHGEHGGHGEKQKTKNPGEFFALFLTFSVSSVFSVVKGL
jgi:hypothetical protein